MKEKLITIYVSFKVGVCDVFVYYSNIMYIFMSSVLLVAF